MPRPNPLTEGLKQARKAEQPEPPAAAPAVVAASSAKAVPPSRVGRVLIGGHFAPEVQTALKVLAAEERSTVQALIAEGIDAVLARAAQAANCRAFRQPPRAKPGLSRDGQDPISKV